jgi:hypothetical protein
LQIIASLWETSGERRNSKAYFKDIGNSTIASCRRGSPPEKDESGIFAGKG